MRKDAVERLTKETTLALVAKTDTDARVRACAVGRLTDQSALLEVVEKDPEPTVARAAMARISNEEDLAATVSTEMPDLRRQEVIQHIRSQRTLAAILAHHHLATPGERELRREVLANISDAGVLHRLLTSTTALSVHHVLSACSRLDWRDRSALAQEIADVKEDRHLLFDVVMCMGWDDCTEGLSILVGAIRDQSLLARIARESRVQRSLRRTAIERITDVETLRDLAVSPGDANDRVTETLSRVAARVLADSREPNTLPMLVAILRASSYPDTVLAVIAGLQREGDQSPLLAVAARESLPRLRRWLEREPESEEREHRDEIHTYTAENPRHAKLREAVAWLERQGDRGAYGAPE